MKASGKSFKKVSAKFSSKMSLLVITSLVVLAGVVIFALSQSVNSTAPTMANSQFKHAHEHASDRAPASVQKSLEVPIAKNVRVSPSRFESRAVAGDAANQYSVDGQLLQKTQDWLVGREATSRADLVEAAKKHPTAFIQLTDELLSKLPADMVEMRKQLLGVTIDVADQVKAQNDQAVSEPFFQTVQSIVERELLLPEIVESDRLAAMTASQKEGLAHAGFAVEKDGAYYQSTFEAKVVSLHLASRLPSAVDRHSIAQRVQQRSYGALAPYTGDSLDLVARDLL